MTITRGSRTGIETLTRTLHGDGEHGQPARPRSRPVGRGSAVGGGARVPPHRGELQPVRPDERADARERRAGPVARRAPECYQAIAGAAEAHRVTGGLFDPRCLRTLEAWGYDRSLPFAAGPVSLDIAAPPAPAAPSGSVAARPRPGQQRSPPRTRPDRPRRHRQGPGRADGGRRAARRGHWPHWSRPAATATWRVQARRVTAGTSPSRTRAARTSPRQSCGSPTSRAPRRPCGCAPGTSMAARCTTWSTRARVSPGGPGWSR